MINGYSFEKVALNFEDLIKINKPRINKIVEVTAETTQ